jgi:20S proteasome alpha/beta subunit
MGSGTLPAMSVLETGWRENMDEEEAKKLVRSVRTPFRSLFRIRKFGSPVCVVDQHWF